MMKRKFFFILFTFILVLNVNLVIVLPTQADASTIATVTSATYTVSTGGTPNETIANVPFGTTKATFLAALTMGEANQTWNETAITDPVLSGNTLVVTAQDGVTTVTYTVTVNAAASTIATVTSATYTVSTGGTPSETITNVPFGTTKATFLAALTMGEANQTWNDTAIADPVLSGNTLVVKAQDGVTIVTYTVTVNAAATNANLSALAISAGTLTPSFASATTSYTASVANSVSSVTVTPTASESHATIKVNGNSVASGTPSATIPLDVGSGNVISIVVTAQDGVTTVTYTVTITRAAASEGGGGGGGGGGAPILGPTTVAGVTNFPSAVDSKGILNQDVNARSDDNNILLHIPAGSAVLAASGTTITQISMIHMTAPPTFQEGAGKISLVYDFTPVGTTFSPTATMRFSYDPTLIPTSIAESSLQIAYYDSTTSSWITLPSTVDTGSHFIYAQITHFTPYAVTYGVKPVPPVPTTIPPVPTPPQPVLPTPATFSASKLVVSPLEVNVGDSVKISALVTNTGGQSGNYAVDLKINGQKVASQSLTLAGGASQTVTFTTTGNAVGNYTVAVSNLSGTFTVKKAPVPATFHTGSLTISPSEIKTGETATVQVTVTNNGDLAGTTTAVLKLNNNIIATKDLALAAGESQNATFTTTQNTAGTYTVDINGQLGSLRVKAYSFFKWLLIPGILAFAISLISTILVGVMRTKGKWGSISSNIESK
jgi:hypothetical protein